MTRFEKKIALGTVVVTVFEDRTVVELVGAETNETDALYQLPFTEQASKAIGEAVNGMGPRRYSALHYMEPQGNA